MNIWESTSRIDRGDFDFSYQQNKFNHIEHEMEEFINEILFFYEEDSILFVTSRDFK